MPVKFNRSTIAISNEGFAPDSKLRSEIRKAERNGAIFHEDKGLAHREDFIRLYSMTMERIGAMPFYRFTDEYFDSLFKRLYGRVRLFWSEVDGKVVSSSLFLTQGNFAHYHLAGSDPAFLHMNINAFHLANSIEALWLEGYKHIHLGGGDGPEEDNSLLRFKRKFSNRSLGYYTSNFDLGADGEQRNE
jgi:lipid II:glycine glycyltransferase (peptidoglycan interpeptide bridge formation enzyme)